MEKKKKTQFLTKMSVRLWLSMMGLIVFAVAFMWVIQIFVLEKGYTGMIQQEIQEQLDPMMEQLKTEDLAEDRELLQRLGKLAKAKMFLVDKNGNRIRYFNGGEENPGPGKSEEKEWEDIRQSDIYHHILEGEPYSKELEEDLGMNGYEVGIPVVYNKEPAYVIIHRSFTELYKVVNINRRHLIILSIILTLVSAVLAAILSGRFVKPIFIIKKTVDDLASGDLFAVPQAEFKDEMGQLSQSVKELGQNLQKVDTLRKEVIANVSHELRSPLALIGGYAEMVRDFHWRDKALREEDLGLIIQESKRMSDMVNDILDYSQLQAGYLQLNKEWYDLCEIVESEIQRCKKAASEHQIIIRYEAASEEMMIFADGLKMSQVIRNLLNNAINHTRSGSLIEVRMTEQEQVFRTQVRNTGDPIPEEEKELIWERYHRSQHQGGRHEGTGLGLSIVSSILEAHEMSYGVDYDSGMTVFWFECPKESRKVS